MSVQEIVAGGGISLIVLLTLVQITPIKINPWTALTRALGNAINRDVLAEIAEVKKQQRKTQAELEKHVHTDDERNADLHRARILQFNRELLRETEPSHTEEDFNEILYSIDCYEKYCAEHPEYQNNRAVHAIKNIGRSYDERTEKHDFL